MNKGWLIALVVTALAVTGCAKKNKVTVDAAFPPPPTATPDSFSSVSDLPPPPANTGSTYYAPPPSAVYAQPAPAAAAPAAGRVHEIRQGETLWKISGMYYGKSSQTGVQKILSANPEIANPNAIRAGQKIVIPD